MNVQEAWLSPTNRKMRC